MALSRPIAAVKSLGQSGFIFDFDTTKIIIDPYLSESVARLHNPDFKRLVPIKYLPNQLADIDWVLITHDHLDHCDPDTLPELASSSPNAKFLGPTPVLEKLKSWGIAKSRMELVSLEKWFALGPDVSVIGVPAAHPEIEIDEEGGHRFVGFVIDAGGHRIYNSGDTSVRPEVVDALHRLGPFHSAFLPVNEINYFKNQAGVIGNMTVREALSLAQLIDVDQFIPVHWDMFSGNNLSPDEIRLVAREHYSKQKISLNPNKLYPKKQIISIIIRTLNEERYLGELLTSIESQLIDNFDVEVVIVDSGSTDQTLVIAELHKCNIVRIKPTDFTFGYALNLGCEHANGEYLVIVSGHCIPKDKMWLQNLIMPLMSGKAVYSYGRQLPGEVTKFSEKRVFDKYFPEISAIPQLHSYVNNANAAILKETWLLHQFHETLTGLEDIELATRLQEQELNIAYVAEAAVYHLHDETWTQVERRYYREAMALQEFSPNLRMGPIMAVYFAVTAIVGDMTSLFKSGKYSVSDLTKILKYRWHQFLGSWRGGAIKASTKLNSNNYFHPNQRI